MRLIEKSNVLEQLSTKYIHLKHWCEEEEMLLFLDPVFPPVPLFQLAALALISLTSPEGYLQNTNPHPRHAYIYTQYFSLENHAVVNRYPRYFPFFFLPGPPSYPCPVHLKVRSSSQSADTSSHHRRRHSHRRIPPDHQPSHSRNPHTPSTSP